MSFKRTVVDLGRDVVSPRKFLLKSMLVSGVAAFFAAHTPSASAQALGDADCPGGYYFHPAYSLCIPYGYAYLPPDYGYSPPIYVAPPYAPYVILSEPPHRNRHFTHRRVFDTDRR
jgi:hypothetical protein